MELIFDHRGYLRPYEIIVCDMTALERYFVSAFPFSTTRQRLWGHYQQYIQDLQTHISEHFTHWLDGSFITQTPDPNDLDLVTFIDAKIFQEKEIALEKYWTFALEDRKLDAYLVEEHKSGSDQYEAVTVHYQNVWRNRFSKDRMGQPKGFLVLTF